MSTLDLSRVVDRTFGNRKHPTIAKLRERAEALDAAGPRAPVDARKAFTQDMLRACLLIGRGRAAS